MKDPPNKSSSSPQSKGKNAATKGTNRLKNPIVASLHATAPSSASYHAISLSPCRDYAVLACNDTLQMIRISPEGLKFIKTIVAAPFFQQTAKAAPGVLEPGSLLNLRDFALGSRATVPSTAPNDTAVVVITHVAWSSGRTPTDATAGDDRRRRLRSSTIAAAGSNGLIVLWPAAPLLDTAGGNTKPVAILNQHVRPVNRLAWHPTNDHLLLSASQDWTVVLWERRVPKKTTDTAAQPSSTRHAEPARKSLFGGLMPHSSQSSNSHTLPTKSSSSPAYQWHSRTTFSPKSEGVRDIQWSPFYEDGTQ